LTRIRRGLSSEINRHCKERGDEAIQENEMRPTTPGLLRSARNDAAKPIDRKMR
jgi:hypothetical protein